MKKDPDHLISVFFLCARGRDQAPESFATAKVGEFVQRRAAK
jgi:hypothetical protein